MLAKLGHGRGSSFMLDCGVMGSLVSSDCVSVLHPTGRCLLLVSVGELVEYKPIV